MIMKRKNYQAPELYSYEEMGECQLMVGTTVPVVPSEEGSQSEAESKLASFEDTDAALRSYEHNPLDYLPRVFKDQWQEE